MNVELIQLWNKFGEITGQVETLAGACDNAGSPDLAKAVRQAETILRNAAERISVSVK